jgi:hypothetical protein
MQRQIHIFMILIFTIVQLVLAQGSSDPIDTFTAKMQKFPGYFTYYWDAAEGRIWLEISNFAEEFLYVNALRQGIGSNDIGLDRGQLGGKRIVYFERSGPRVLLIQPNYQYRAVSSNPDEQKAVRQSFAASVLGGFLIKKESKRGILIDFTDFLMQDAHGIAARLKEMNEGEFTADPGRSFVRLEATKNFPLNSEFEVLLTFTTEDPGPLVKQVTPTPAIISVYQHHALIRLPDNGYQMRKFHPQAGYFGIEYSDYASDFTQPLEQRYIARHRLVKKYPDRIMSEPVKPIVYYVDRGVPEPVRTALIEGARWWNEAFESAGFIDAFRVELLPEEADPLDIRYNVIQWVHRSTRGWSYGDAVIDPRTGEIIKGHISLGSLRIRQDFLIAEGLLAPYAEGKASTDELASFALSRIRQLSAHEVGHTLGLMHNYAASTADRASVMDYPHPLILAGKDEKPDLSRAYTDGIGRWDKLAIEYGYRQFDPGVDQDSALKAVLVKGASQGLIFLSDDDARPAHSAHPAAHLWDNGDDAVTELQRLIGIRAGAIDRLSEHAVRPGEPLATLEERLVPIYLLHRYQVEAAAKIIGGLNYSYAMREEPLDRTAIVDPARQRQALDVLLETIQPAFLRIPDRILALLPPRPPGYPRGRELFQSWTGLTFDPLNAAAAASDHTIGFILNPQRAARLVENHARNSENPSLQELISKTITATWHQAPQPGMNGALQQTVAQIVMNHLFNLGVYPDTNPSVHANVYDQLLQLRKYLSGKIEETSDQDWRAFYRYAIHQIDQFERAPDELKIPVTPVIPDGPPIGLRCFGSF